MSDTREAFEAWFARGVGDGKKPHRDDSGHGYFYPTTQAMWEGWLSSRRVAMEEADETMRLLFRTVDALQSLLDDSQHKEHPDCEDGGYCPVRDAREAMRNFAAWQERRASAIRREAAE